MTLAEQAVKRFETAPKTLSLVNVAAKLGGRRVEKGPAALIKLTFPDASTLTIRGRGRAHSYEAGKAFK